MIPIPAMAIWCGVWVRLQVEGGIELERCGILLLLLC